MSKDTSDWRSTISGNAVQTDITYKTSTAAKGSTVSLTVTPHVAVYKYHFAAYSSFGAVGIQCGDGGFSSNISVIDNQTIQVTGSGHGKTIYYYIRSSVQGEPGTSGSTTAYFKYTGTSDVVVAVTMSYTNMATAQGYFNNEFASMGFAAAVQNLKDAWNAKFNLLEATGDSDSLQKFYTALYTMYANIIDVSDGALPTSYRPFITVSSSDNWQRVGSYLRCTWDTWRNVEPLLAMIDPDLMTHILNSYLSQYDRDGAIYGDYDPLSGWDGGLKYKNDTPQVFLHSYLVGVQGVDWIKAKNACYDTIHNHLQNRQAFFQYHYLPSDMETSNSCSRSFEYGFETEAMALLANLVGDTATYNQDRVVRQYYQNLWDPSVGYFRSKNSSGVFGGDAFFEGSHNDYAFAIPNDPYGLIGLYGSDQNFVTKVLNYLNSAWYNDYQLIYQFWPIYANSPGDAQWATRKSFLPLFKSPYIMAEGFSGTTPWGCYYEGNAGAVVVAMTGLGWISATDQFVINSPSFTKLVMHLKNGTVTINAPNNNANNIYIQSLNLNGTRYPSYVIAARQLATGGNMTFDLNMTSTPARIGNLYLGSSDALVSSATSDDSTYLEFTVDPCGLTDSKAKVYCTLTSAPTVKINGNQTTDWSYDSNTKVLTINHLVAGTVRVETSYTPPPPPGSFSLSGPPNGAVNVATNPILGWGASSNAASYTLVVDDNSNYSSPIFNQDVGNVTTKQVTGLAGSTTYYWKVTAHNISGDTPASNNSFSFTTAAAPSGQTMEAEDMTLTNYVVNTNSSASGGELIKLSGSGVTGNAVFNFAGATGTYDIKVYYYDESDGACTFNVYAAGVKVDTWVANQNLGSIDPVAATRTSRTKTGVSIANGAQIKLEAVQNSQEWGRYDIVEITAAAPPQPPGSFGLSSPANGATGLAANPTLSWGASSGATSYILVVDDQSDYSSPIFNRDVGNVTSKQVTGLANSTTYYWQVTAHNSAGDTAASNNSFSFTTAAAPVGQTMEAENMTLTNYVVNTNSSASGGKLIKLSGSGVTGNAVFNFTGSTGTYNIKVYYYDESDGACTFNVYVAGVKVDTWVANQNLGSIDPVAATRTSRTISGVSIANGAQIKLEAVQNSQEWGRYDIAEIAP